MHLQDMTVMTGHVYRQYRFGKRTFRTGPGAVRDHEMNRCIHCTAACVLQRIRRRPRLRLVLSAPPRLLRRAQTGRLRASQRHLSRCARWACSTTNVAGRLHAQVGPAVAPAVCLHCGRGCATIPGERAASCPHPQTLQDQVTVLPLRRGRYGFGFVNSEHRLHAAACADRSAWSQRHTVVDRLTRLFADGRP